MFAGHLYFAQHRTADAKAALSKAERLGTDDPWLQNNWADILLAEGKLDEAAARYKKVVASQTKNSKAMGAAIEGLIEYHQKLGETDQVDRLYQLAISREPQSAWQYGNYAGFLLCTQDNYELAITNARKALSLMNYGIARQALAAALYRKWAAEALGGNGAMAAQTKVEAAQLSVGSPVSVVGEFCGTGPALEAVDKARFAPR